MERLGDIGKIITGNTPKTSEAQNYASNDICFVKPSDIDEKRVTEVYSSEYWISECAREKARILSPNSVLVTCIGIIGKIAINRVECAFNQQINAIIPDNKKCIPEYVAYALYAKQKELQDTANAPVVPILNKTQFSDIRIRVPSLEIQRTIVDRITCVSRMIDLRKRQFERLDELVKVRFVEMFGDPEYNSKGWPIHDLGELCSVGSSKRIYQNEQSSEGVPFWRISDLVSKMDTGTVDSDLFIPEEKYLELKNSNLVPTLGDILVTSRGTLGRCYIIKADDRFYFQDGMISWLSNYANGITPLYLQYLFTMPGFRKQIDSMQAGSTVAYLSIAMLKKLHVMVPDKEVQESFADFVTQTDKSKVEIKKSLEQLETLKKAMMQKYFG